MSFNSQGLSFLAIHVLRMMEIDFVTWDRSSSHGEQEKSIL
jgi:hypothetical protein